MPRRSKYTKRQHEHTRIVPHAAKGLMIESIKPSPNAPCFCGSGLKQKKCHGRDAQLKYHRTKSYKEPVKKVYEFIHISLKYTPKKAEYFSLVRSDYPNKYTYFMDSDSKFKIDAPVDSLNECSIQVELTLKYIIKIKHEGYDRIVIPNTEEVREAFGITLAQLKGRTKKVSDIKA